MKGSDGDFDLHKLFRALIFALLAIGWSAFSSWLLRGSSLGSSWIGIVFAFGPAIALLVLFVINMLKGFKLSSGRD